MPRHIQLREILARDFYARYAVGEKLPTEAELCRRFGLSRATVRKALDYFVQSGSVERTAGRGTFLVRKDSDAPASAAEPGLPVLTFVALFDHMDGVLEQALGIFEHHAMTRGYHLVLVNSAHGPEAVADRLRTITNERSNCGAILYPDSESGDEASCNEAVITELFASNTPFVVVDRLPFSSRSLTALDDRALAAEVASIQYDFVIPDNRLGGAMAANHLLRLGHRCVSMIGDRWVHSSFLREKGFRETVGQFGDGAIAEVVRHESLVGDHHAEEALRTVVERGATALFAENDIIARELLLTLQRIGLRVPGDISLIGYDDADFCPYLPVPLTTIRQPIGRQLDLAAEILLSKLKEPTNVIRHVLLPVELIERESTAAVVA